MTAMQKSTLIQIYNGKGYTKAHAKRLQEQGFVDFKRGKAQLTQSGLEKAETLAGK